MEIYLVELHSCLELIIVHLPARYLPDANRFYSLGFKLSNQDKDPNLVQYYEVTGASGTSSSPGFNKQCQEMILVNKEENSWTVSLRFSKSDGMYYIERGWKKFSLDNRCDIGDLLVFNLVGDGKLLHCRVYVPKERVS
ncbi:hypothetical protein Bca52824_014732 [Brassica carinata]|uniref:TF-B3 domain-containing protein n=1 Tax=Brassica carinata TaxID=52824 RepID=A0A8X8B2L2_BRACI|nr:hypothetical protein Bca52824_014732 [Brassica carinata]